MRHSLQTLPSSLSGGLLHLFYPNICWACGVSMPVEMRAFCAACRAALTTDPFPTCPSCSSTVGPFAHVEKGCPACRDESFAFDRAIRLAPYEGLLREMILRMKHYPGEGVAEVVGRLWAEHAGTRLLQLEADVVVPVPLHWRRRWRRGYNQAETLARAVARQLSLPLLPRGLRRTRYTPIQPSTASAQARRDNVRGVFRVSKYVDLEKKTVLLVDDVMTTGSTASEAARALKKAGAAQVAAAVLAHGH